MKQQWNALLTIYDNLGCNNKIRFMNISFNLTDYPDYIYGQIIQYLLTIYKMI